MPCCRASPATRGRTVQDMMTWNNRERVTGSGDQQTAPAKKTQRSKREFVTIGPAGMGELPSPQRINRPCIWPL